MSVSGRLVPHAANNRLLAGLPRSEYRRLRPHLELVSLDSEQIVCEPGQPIEHVYFPTQAAVSLLAVMQDGSSVEVASVGKEGLVGLPALLNETVIQHRVMAHFPGEALRVPAAVFKNWASSTGPLAHRLPRYINSFLTQVAQLAACNALHRLEQRYCRWILTSHDRLQSDELPLTHRLLAQMLGVRRSGITEASGPLQDAGLIHCARGKVVILNRPKLMAASCECYQVISAEYSRPLS